MNNVKQIWTDDNWGKADCQEALDDAQSRLAEGGIHGLLMLGHNKDGDFFVTIRGEMNRCQTLGQIEIMKDRLLRDMLDG